MKTTRTFQIAAFWLLSGWLGVWAQVPTQPSVGQQPTGAAASGQQPGAQQPAGTGSVVAQPGTTPGTGVNVPSQPGSNVTTGSPSLTSPEGPVNLQPGVISTFNSGLGPAPTGLKPGNQAGNGKRFTLQEAIDFAIETNVNVRNGKLDAVSAEARIREIKASALPQIAGSASLTDNLIIQRAFLPAVFFDQNAPPDAPAIPVQFGVNYSGNATINLNQVIYSASLNVGLRAAATYRELAQRNLQATKVTVAEQVAKAYYSVLVALERAKLLDYNINRIDTLLIETRALNNQGFVEKLDVQRLEVQANNLKAERQNVQNLIELSYALLKFQMGLGVNDEITLAEQLQDRAVDDLRPLISPDPTFQYSSRIEYSTLETQIKLAEQDIEVTQKGYFPTLAAFANYGYNTGRNKIDQLVTTPWFNFSTLGISLQVPIFDGFLKKNQIAQKRITLQKAQNSGELLRNSIDLQIRQASITLRNGLQTLQTQQRNRDLAEEIVRVTRIKYKEGVGSSIEVLNAEASLREAQTNYFASLYDFLIAKVDQDKSLGRLYTGGN
ncbi:outer membrane efflux protein [Fibrisoma limi BUZ 3]|uniref:Outer membrane efflux protein n=1 Tax=Fibrisoma limi BUZ 3 TaxID=1185876 RepID=I2GRU9_9BACT|nr:TolC family protein [Fibrisoma limi]CCH56627.1 outer membrane efflux protein [Fibrisoma limi BUZ 3]